MYPAGSSRTGSDTLLSFAIGPCRKSTASISTDPLSLRVPPPGQNHRHRLSSWESQSLFPLEIPAICAQATKLPAANEGMSPELQDKLAACESLPTLPAAAAKVVETINNDDYGLSDLATIVENDAAISAKLIAIANAAAYRRGAGSDNVQHAVSRLGVRATVMTTLSFSLADTFNASSSEDQTGIDAEWLGRRSIVSAAIARQLATALELPSVETGFLAALVQDIGVLAINEVQPDVYSSMTGADHETLIEVERTRLGVDHSAIGVWLLEHWAFPDIVVDLVRHSHDLASLTQGSDIDQLTWCVAGSGVLADALVDRDEMRIGRTLNLLKGVCGEKADGLEDDIGRAIAETEHLFETDLIIEPLALMTTSKALLFEYVMGVDLSAPDDRIVQLERRVAVLEKDGRLDTLTGVHNRAYFERELERAFDHAQETQQSISLMFIDADHFKHINDTHGHLAGDEVLKWLATSLKRLVRGTDMVSRFGGEEFVVLLPTMNETDAKRFGERICDTLRNDSVYFENTKIPVTVSIGIACSEPSRPVLNARELVFAADQAMYFAKQSGRDLCVGASALPTNTVRAESASERATA